MSLIQLVGRCLDVVPLVDKRSLMSATLDNVEVNAVSDIGNGGWIAISRTTPLPHSGQKSTECALRCAIKSGHLGQEGYIPCLKCGKGYNYRVLKETEI